MNQKKRNEARKRGRKQAWKGPGSHVMRSQKMTLSFLTGALVGSHVITEEGPLRGRIGFEREMAHHAYNVLRCCLMGSCGKVWSSGEEHGLKMAVWWYFHVVGY